MVSEVSGNTEAPLVYKRSRQVGVSGTPFRTTPVMKYLNTLRVIVSEVSDNKEAPLVYKRSHQDGVSGSPFRTTPVMKYLNSLWL
jgi:hypothetical protein